MSVSEDFKANVVRKFQRANDSKAAIREVIAEAGGTSISNKTLFEDFPEKIKEAVDYHSTASDAIRNQNMNGNLCALTININHGEEAVVPDAELMARLLDGAFLKIRIGSVSVNAPVITTLAKDTTVTYAVLLPHNAHHGKVTLFLNPAVTHGTGLRPMVFMSDDFGANAMTINFDMTYQKVVNCNVFGMRRFKGYMSVNTKLMDIVEEYDAEGNVTAEDSMYLDEVTSRFVSTSSIVRSIPQYDKDTGELVQWHVKNEGDPFCNDLYGVAAEGVNVSGGIFPWNSLEYKTYETTIFTNSANTTTATIENHMTRMGVEVNGRYGVYLSRIDTTFELKGVDGEGNITYSTQAVEEVRIASTAIDASFEFVELPERGQYKISRSTFYRADKLSASIEYSSPTGQSMDNGTRRDYHLANMQNCNDFEWTLNGEAVDLTESHYVGYLWEDMTIDAYLSWMEAGDLNVQNHIWGDATGAPKGALGLPRTSGVTKKMEELGIFMGVIADPQGDASFRARGIENPWCGIGTFLHDVTNVGGKLYWNPDFTNLENNYSAPEDGETTTQMMIRLGFQPVTQLLPNSGYIKELAPALLEGEGEEPRNTLLVPTVSGGSTTTYYADYVYVSKTAETAYFCALGRDRSIGARLGAFCFCAYDGWSLSNGYGWSGRITLRHK